jgi:hypothetical protein
MEYRADIAGVELCTGFGGQPLSIVHVPPVPRQAVHEDQKEVWQRSTDQCDGGMS